MKKQNPFYILVLLFFLWGFLTSLNDILVPHLKAAFDLKHWQAQLIQFCFFGAFFLMSIPAGAIIKKLGYKWGIVIGLALMGTGCLLFVPASYVNIYGVFLFGLFVLASGVTVLQVAANPYVAVLGSAETSASRLNLAQGFNSIGHTVAPLIGAWLILQNTERVDVTTVRLPYLLIALTLFTLAIIFAFIQLPDIKTKTEEKRGFKLFDHPHLYLGALAIFCYVGAEITVGSFLVEYFTNEPSIGLSTKTAGSYVALYWGGAMVGRFLGAISLGKNKSIIKMASIPIIAIIVLLLSLYIKEQPLSIALGFGIMLVLNFMAFTFGKSISNKQLALFAGINMILLCVTMFSSGDIALWSILGIGLFNSIMWSNIFTLAIDKLGAFTSNGSSILIMMVVGGAIIPIIQGFAADTWLGVKFSFIVPVLAYLYLVFYGMKGYRTTIG